MIQEIFQKCKEYRRFVSFYTLLVMRMQVFDENANVFFVLESSRPEEPPLQALTEPDVKLSLHPALLIQRPSSRCNPNVQTISVMSHDISQAQERRLCLRNRLYLFFAQHPNLRSILIRNHRSGSG